MTTTTVTFSSCAKSLSIGQISKFIYIIIDPEKYQKRENRKDKDLPKDLETLSPELVKLNLKFEELIEMYVTVLDKHKHPQTALFRNIYVKTITDNIIPVCCRDWFSTSVEILSQRETDPLPPFPLREWLKSGEYGNTTPLQKYMTKRQRMKNHLATVRSSQEQQYNHQEQQYNRITSI